MPPTDHPDWAAFLRAIVADPDDDTPRLVAADWLEETGQRDWAALIRLQVELARLERSGLGLSAAAVGLRRKEREFLRPAYVDRLFWAVDACPGLVGIKPRPGSTDPLALQVVGADRLTFRRGFVEEVACSAVEWLRYGRAVRERQPVRTVRLGRCAELTRDQWYQMIPALTGLREVVAADAPGWFPEWFRYWVPGVRLMLAQ